MTQSAQFGANVIGSNAMSSAFSLNPLTLMVLKLERSVPSIASLNIGRCWKAGVLHEAM